MADIKRALSDGKVTALRLLKQARDDADDAGRDARQYALTKASLLQAGATESDLRWLVDQHFVQQFAEITRPGDGERQFRTATALSFPENVCFILSHGGKIYVETHGLDGLAPRQPMPAPTASGISPADRVRWNRQRHELWVDGKLAKRYTHNASAQWKVLDGFEDRNWQTPIVFKLPCGGSRRSAADRLRDHVAKLNEGLDESLIHFRMDGAGAITFDLPGAI